MSQPEITLKPNKIISLMLLTVEMPGGAYFENMGDDWRYTIFYTIEETLEMLGLVLFIHTLLDYMSRHTSTPVAIKVNGDLP